MATSPASSAGLVTASRSAFEPESSSARTGSAPPSPSASTRRFERVGTSVAAMTYGYWTGLAVDGYEWNFRPDAASGVVPTNDGQACVYASASPRRDRPGRHRTAHPDRRGVVSRPRRPARHRHTAARAAHLHRSAGPCPTIVGSRLGPGRRRGLLQGSAHRTRADRRVARRRTARPRDRRRHRRRCRRTRRSGRLPADTRRTLQRVLRPHRHDCRTSLDRRGDPRPPPSRPRRDGRRGRGPCRAAPAATPDAPGVRHRATCGTDGRAGSGRL